MCGWPYLDTMHVDRANLIMRYLSIHWPDLKTGNTIATVRISRSFLWYVMNELMHVMQRQVNACNARTNWCRWCNLWYMDGHSSHSPWLNHGCKFECLQVSSIFSVRNTRGLCGSNSIFSYHVHWVMSAATSATWGNDRPWSVLKFYQWA